MWSSVYVQEKLKTVTLYIGKGKWTEREVKFLYLTQTDKMLTLVDC